MTTSFLNRSTGRAGLGIIALLSIAALVGPLIAPHDPAAMNPMRSFEPAGAEFLLGTDNLGRDMLSRLLHGARWSLGLALLATSLIMTLGVLLGAIAGLLGGLVDEVLMRTVDAVLAVPTLLLALAIVGIIGPGTAGLMIGLSAAWWVTYARVVRGMVLSLRERDYVIASRALGSSERSILRQHVLPGIIAPVSVLASLEMGQLVLAISGLSFLGVGAQPPTPEWGAMLSDGRRYFFEAPRLVLLPGFAITLAVLGFNLLGDAVRDSLSPQELARVQGGRK
jgi:peptide/nickel transport system permease protein